ncbi:MAG TPA: hypothetical protein VGF20_11780 [Candidatus Acidoferrum sp.]|jgi:hypothetical protein
MASLTLVHVLISVIGIISGLIVLFGFLKAKRMDGWNAIFLVSTILTSITGYFFPFHKLLPSHILGAISLPVLALALVARYSKHMAGPWLRTYIISAMVAFWLNFFVLIAQAFMKQPALHALAPTGSEPPFLITQVVVMLIFIALTVFAVKHSRV